MFEQLAARGDDVAAVRLRNLASACLLMAGAVSGSVAVFVLPGWNVSHRPALAAIASVIAAGAVLQSTFARSVRVWAAHLASIGALAGASLAQALVGDPMAAAAIGLLYVWVAAFAALFYRLGAVAVYLALIFVAQMLVAGPGGATVVGIAPSLVLVTATCVMVAALTMMLAGTLRGHARVDALTGLLNRRGLSEVLATELAMASRRGWPLCVAVADIDGFKSVNDAQGHAAGDRVLAAAAAVWRGLLRPGDRLARTGGDEFTLILPNCDLAGAEALGARLVAATRQDSGISCSVGVACYNRAESSEELIDRADKDTCIARNLHGLNSTPSRLRRGRARHATYPSGQMMMLP